jgi:predicted secreted protein
MIKYLLLFCLACLSGVSLSKAESSKEILDTVVTLSATEQKKVEQDILVASLRIEVENKDSRKVQEDINEAMQKALSIVKGVPSIKSSTGNYYVYSYDPNPSPTPLSKEEMKNHTIWKGSQTIDLKSKDSQKILEAVAKIHEAGFVMGGLNYILSPELAEAQKDMLLVGALNKIKSKADLISKTLGKSGYDIIEVNIDGSYIPQPQPVMMMKAANAEMVSDSMSAPVAAPGESDVSVTVSTKIQLK